MAKEYRLRDEYLKSTNPLYRLFGKLTKDEKARNQFWLDDAKRLDKSPKMDTHIVEFEDPALNVLDWHGPKFQTPAGKRPSKSDVENEIKKYFQDRSIWGYYDNSVNPFMYLLGGLTKSERAHNEKLNKVLSDLDKDVYPFAQLHSYEYE